MNIDTSREAVERLLDGVTPGPWHCTMGKLVRIVKVVSRNPIVLAGIHRFGSNGGKATDGDCEANGRFIAASRDLVPALLARAEAAEAEVARLSHAHAALRAKLAEVEQERNTLRSDNSGLNHILWMMEADRDEERKLADDAVHELKHARAVLRHEQYLDDPGREAVIARHAARRKE